jgi:sugar-specific transcriptional regulator TrmB
MKQELIGIGFKEREAEIYLTLLRLGKSTVTTLAKDLSLDRRVLYDSLDIMAKKGRIIITKVNNVSYYIAVPPKELKNQVEDSVDEFKKIIADLERLEVKKKESEVRIWYGIKAVSRLIHSAMESKEEVLLMGRGGYLEEQLGDSKHQFIPKLNKIRWRMIQTQDYKRKKHKFKPHALKYLPKNINVNTAFAVTGNKLYLFTKKKQIEIIEIIDKDFADTHKSYFNMFWKIAKK